MKRRDLKRQLEEAEVGTRENEGTSAAIEPKHVRDKEEKGKEKNRHEDDESETVRFLLCSMRKYPCSGE